jgi:hypothetical protein
MEIEIYVIVGIIFGLISSGIKVSLFLEETFIEILVLPLRFGK